MSMTLANPRKWEPRALLIMKGDCKYLYRLMVFMKEKEYPKFSVNTDAVDAVRFRFEEFSIQARMPGICTKKRTLFFPFL